MAQEQSLIRARGGSGFNPRWGRNVCFHPDTGIQREGETDIRLLDGEPKLGQPLGAL